MKHTIYKVVNKLNGKIYIGAHSTNNPDDNYYGSGKLILRALKKYGVENFEKEILFVFGTKSEMFARERELVTQNFVDRRDTYNVNVGGDTPPMPEHTEESRQQVSERFKGIKLSEEHKQKISKTKKDGYHPYRGKKLTKEHKEKNRQAQLSRKHSEETKAKMRKAKLGKNNPNYGKKPSEETRKKMSIAQRGRKHTKETRKKMSQSARGNTYAKGYKQTKEHKQKLRKSRIKTIYDILMIGVDYEEFKPETYKGVFIFADEVIKVYNSGDFRKDFRDARVFANRRGKKVIYSSTIDNFITDHQNIIESPEVTK